MSSPVRILLIGAKGRMGQTIAGLCQERSDITIGARCDLGDSIGWAMKDCDVAIDFSQADAIESVCNAALTNRTPLVIGTTGHSPPQRDAIEEAAKTLPIVFASNFSVGVNALFWLTRKTAGLLGPEFGVEIIETHHRTKKDAPSGTAKTLAGILKQARSIDDVPTQSIREGEVVGEHTVIFTGPGERLELKHIAKSRDTFAKGALDAAQWVVEKPAGLYSMQDVLGL